MPDLKPVLTLRDLVPDIEGPEPASKPVHIIPSPRSVKKVTSKPNKKDSPEWQAWKMAKGRCNNPNSSGYKYYGACGIKFYEPWARSFEDFLEYMGPRPPGHALLRKNKRGHYEPGNVYWGSISDARVGVRKDPMHQAIKYTIPGNTRASAHQVTVYERNNAIQVGPLRLDVNQALEVVRAIEIIASDILSRRRGE